MKSFMTLAAALTAFGAAAAIPESYYDSLNGASGAELKEAAKKVAATHEVVAYGDATWEAFKTTDIRIVDGREAWFDMYSNVIVWVSSGHAGMNIEHSVPNSWWGGIKNDAYKDLYHLNPSNADANNRKSNHPLGQIDGQPTWTNGISSIGAPVVGQGGGSDIVFEPADEYKGDFARAYFYVFTIYDDIPWLEETDKNYMYDGTSYPTLRPWAYDLLLQWAEADPVDSREQARNEAVSAIQGNRNPFIDIPDLADYIWGSRKEVPFSYYDVQNPTIVDRPAAPVFENCELVAVNTYTTRWWNATSISVGGTTGDIYVSVDGGDYTLCQGGVIDIPAAASNGAQMLVSAYAVAETDGRDYYSGLSTLTLTAKDPQLTDLTKAEWTLTVSDAEITTEDTYIIVAATSLAVMGDNTGGAKVMPVAGNVTPDSEGRIYSLPEGTGIVRLLDNGEGYVLQVSDIYGELQGCIEPTAAKALRLSDEGLAASITVDADGVAVIDYGSTFGNLQYNASSPRFVNYTSNQEALSLYRLTDATGSVEGLGMQPEIYVSGRNINAPAGSVVFDLNGRRVSADGLIPGVYLVVTPAHHHAKVIVR